MHTRRQLALALATGCCLAAAVFGASSLGAQSASGALANFTPGRVKIFHTGGSQPNSQYADLGRLALPVGSWAILAHTVLWSTAPSSTGVDCFLVAANASAVHTPMEIQPTKGDNIKDLYLNVVTTAPDGGHADLLCKVSNPAADRRVFAQDTSIMAISVSGTTLTHSPAPAPGTY
jgi:hypothetical protein